LRFDRFQRVQLVEAFGADAVGDLLVAMDRVARNQERMCEVVVVPRQADKARGWQDLSNQCSAHVQVVVLDDQRAWKLCLESSEEPSHLVLLRFADFLDGPCSVAAQPAVPQMQTVVVTGQPGGTAIEAPRRHLFWSEAAGRVVDWR